MATITGNTGPELSPPTATTLTELGMTLVMAQTHLLELIGHCDPEGRYSKAFEHVRAALELVQEGQS